MIAGYFIMEYTKVKAKENVQIQSMTRSNTEDNVTPKHRLNEMLSAVRDRGREK